jgi:pSer/pThr/pTyr-binding forkhead associated (FHA) protein
LTSIPAELNHPDTGRFALDEVAMKDGFTKKMKGPHEPASFADFRSEFSIKLVVIAGPSAGTVHAVQNSCVTLGRGPDVDIEFADTAMSRQHAAIEYADGALHVRDLGSTNGIACNGAVVQAAQLEHGDQLKIGEHTLQLLVEKRDTEPETYVISGTV